MALGRSGSKPGLIAWPRKNASAKRPKRNAALGMKPRLKQAFSLRCHMVENGTKRRLMRRNGMSVVEQS